MSQTLSAEEQLKLAQQENESLKKENAQLKKGISEQDEIIKDLQNELEAARESKVSGAKMVVTHNKEKYEVTCQTFKFGGVDYKAEALLENKQLVKALVEAGVGILVKL